MKTYLYRKKQESFRAPKRDGEIRFFFIWDDPKKIVCQNQQKTESSPRIKYPPLKIPCFFDHPLLLSVKNHQIKKSQNPVLQGFWLLVKTHNGAGGSRTRVQTSRYSRLYARSQFYLGDSLKQSPSDRLLLSLV